MLFLSSFFFTLSVSGARFILFPKSGVSSDLVMKLAEENNLERFATVHQDVFYFGEESNMLNIRNTVSPFFEIEEDSSVSINQGFIFSDKSDDKPIPWHLDRVVKRDLPLNNSFPLGHEGMCHANEDLVINSYIVDTGIDVTHSQFGNRAHWGSNFADDKDTDCNSHGTHVAGLVGSNDYGVCVDANLIAVKVLDCDGSGTLSGVIRGIEWVLKQHLTNSASSKQIVKSIINMSLGGGYSRAVNRAVESCLKNDNFYIAVAAGNENADACQTSPASSEGALTVMASGPNDERAWFSNWGTCSDIYSPGVNILSTTPNEGTAVYSGTSMATPIMVGVLNHYIDQYPNLDMKALKAKVLLDSTKNKITKNAESSNNYLVFLQRL
jgi:subtilisin family serine protease